MNLVIIYRGLRVTKATCIIFLYSDADHRVLYAFKMSLICNRLKVPNYAFDEMHIWCTLL